MNVKRTEERGAHMGIRATILLCLGLALVTMTMGCGEETIQTAPTTADFEKDRAALASRKAAKPQTSAGAANAASAAQATAAAASDADETDYAAGGQDYFYDPRNKRDPFRSYRFA